MYTKAFMEGYDYFWNSTKGYCHDNPYTTDSEEFEYWREGFYAAELDYYETDE